MHACLRRAGVSLALLVAVPAVAEEEEEEILQAITWDNSRQVVIDTWDRERAAQLSQMGQELVRNGMEEIPRAWAEFVEKERGRHVEAAIQHVVASARQDAENRIVLSERQLQLYQRLGEAMGLELAAMRSLQDGVGALPLPPPRPESTEQEAVYQARGSDLLPLTKLADTIEQVEALLNQVNETKDKAQFELQMAINDFSNAQQMQSNIQKRMHDSSKTVINNLKG